MRTVPGLAPLVARLRTIREMIESLKQQELDVEQQIVTVTGFDRVEGSQTFADAQIGEMRVSIKRPLYRYVDEAAWRSIEADAPPIVQECIRWKADVAIRQLRALQTTHPELADTLSACLTAKPGKISVRIDS